MRLWIFLLAVVALLFGMLWASDSITMQGERTIYTIDCDRGQWQAAACTGRRVAGARYRFRALTAHREVLFWRLGTTEPSGAFNDCDIVDGRNWRCKAGPRSTGAITREMAHGVPLPDPSLPKPLVVTSKLHWYLLKWGLVS